jgi:zinc transport system permease protein
MIKRGIGERDIMELGELLRLAFVQRAIIVGVLVALVASMLGILVVLKRASFFGDALAHASLTGVAIGLLTGVSPVVTAGVYAALVALALPYLSRKSLLPLDSLLGFVLPFSVGLGVILIATLPGYQPELVSYLFGSVLAVSWREVGLLAVLVLVVVGVMVKWWKELVFVGFDEDYARIARLKVDWLNWLYYVLLAVSIVVGIRLVGVVLVNSLLVIPAGTSRMFAKSLRQMYLVTPLVSVGVTLLGILAALVIDVPTGPAIAVASGLVFVATIGVRQIWGRVGGK